MKNLNTLIFSFQFFFFLNTAMIMIIPVILSILEVFMFTFLYVRKTKRGILEEIWDSGVSEGRVKIADPRVK